MKFTFIFSLCFLEVARRSVTGDIEYKMQNIDTYTVPHIPKPSVLESSPKQAVTYQQ